jgi:hypothetical protein
VARCSRDRIERFVLAKKRAGWRAPVAGGLSDGRSVRGFSTDALVDGLVVELEHTSDWNTALRIAMDHLVESRDYYRYLEQVERRMTRNPKKVPKFYLEVTQGDDGWYWFIGREGSSRWSMGGGPNVFRRDAITQARKMFKRYRREMGISDYHLTERIEPAPKGSPYRRNRGNKMAKKQRRNYTPPKKRWAKKAVKRPGKLGGKGFMSKPFAEQKKILRRCVREYGYRSCLGSIMFIHNINKDPKIRAKAKKLKDWLVREYGGSYNTRKNPPDGSWEAVPILLVEYVGYGLAAVRLTDAQARELARRTG